MLGNRRKWVAGVGWRGSMRNKRGCTSVVLSTINRNFVKKETKLEKVIGRRL